MNTKSKKRKLSFISPTYGRMTVFQVRKRIVSFMEEDPYSRYRLIIGTDSQGKNGIDVDFITAIVVHRIGGGGIYFWKRVMPKKRYVLRNRIYEEASFSLKTATDFLRTFKKNGIASYEVEIHVDIGKVGETRDMIAEIVGMIRGSGFSVKTKPDAYGASNVADRHT